jgi:hypothetical protein
MVRRSHARRSRGAERGAAVFIVIMVVTLLTAIGVFAARSASLVDVAVGYDRMAVQTQFLSEYAGRLAVTEFGHPLKAATYQKALNDPDADEVCHSNASFATSDDTKHAPCYKFDTSDLDAIVKENYSDATVLEAQSADTGGSLGPRLGGGTNSLEGALMVEVLDAFQSYDPPPGNDQGNTSRTPKPFQFTITSWAQVRSIAEDQQSLDNPWCAGDAQSSTSASVQRLRAYVTAPIGSY